MSIRTTRRTNNEISTFIQIWIAAASTREVATALARRRKDWPYSIAVSSISQFASQLRSNGVELPYMDSCGQAIDAGHWNRLISSC